MKEETWKLHLVFNIASCSLAKALFRGLITVELPRDAPCLHNVCSVKATLFQKSREGEVE